MKYGVLGTGDFYNSGSIDFIFSIQETQGRYLY